MSTSTVAERDAILIQICEAANSDPDIASIQMEFNALHDEIFEPWH